MPSLQMKAFPNGRIRPSHTVYKACSAAIPLFVGTHCARHKTAAKNSPLSSIKTLELFPNAQRIEQGNREGHKQINCS